jgi:hypothetical protein
MARKDRGRFATCAVVAVGLGMGVHVGAAETYASAGCARVSQIKSLFPRASAAGFRARGRIGFQRHERVPFPGDCGVFGTTYYLRSKASGPKVEISVTLYENAGDLAAPLAEPAYGPVHRQRNGARVRTIATRTSINGVPAHMTGAVSAYRDIFISSDDYTVAKAVPTAVQLRVHRQIEAALRALG